MLDSFQFKLNNVYNALNKPKLFFFFFNIAKNNQKIFKTIFFKSSGLLTNNLNKSYLFRIIYSILTIFNGLKLFKQPKLINKIYFIPIKVLTLSINKSHFKTLLIFF
jgi:hypothetical protein